MASTTATHPDGIDSIAARVEIGEPQDSGVARSSRAGTNRKVKAGPTSRLCPGRNGFAPRIQTLRSPFLCNTVVSVAVATPRNASIVFSSSPIFICPVKSWSLLLPSQNTRDGPSS
jgi:hypothetical protein